MYALSCPTLCDFMDCSLPGIAVHGHSPDKNTGVGCHFLLQGIFLTQGSNLCLPALAGKFFTTEPPGKSEVIGGTRSAVSRNSRRRRGREAIWQHECVCANAKETLRWSEENEPGMPGRPEMSEVQLEMEHVGLLRDFLLTNRTQ